MAPETIRAIATRRKDVLNWVALYSSETFMLFQLISLGFVAFDTFRFTELPLVLKN